MTPDTREPQKFTRRKLLSAAGAGIAVGIAGSIVGRVITPFDGSKAAEISAASPTASSTLIPESSPTPTSTESPTPEPSKSPEFKFANIEGLKFDSSTKKYFAEAGNSYGLENNAYAGEQVIYTLGNEKTSGVVLVGNVVRVISSEANTSDAIAQEKWQIPFPIDPRTAKKPIKISEGKTSGVSYLAISDLSNLTFVSPFETATLIEAKSTVGGLATELDYFPQNLVSSKQGLVFNHYGTLDAKQGQKVQLGQALISDNTQDKYYGPPFLQGTQAFISVSGSRTPGSISLSNILSVDNQKIFLAKTQ